MGLILLIVILFLVFGGGGGYLMRGNPQYGYIGGGGIGLGTIFVILLIWYLLRGGLR